MDLNVAADALPTQKRLRQERRLVGRSGALERHRRDQNPDHALGEILQRRVDAIAPVRGVEVEGHFVEAGHRFPRKLGTQRDDQRVVVEVPVRGHDDPVVEVERQGFGVAELDPLRLQPGEWPRELTQAPFSDHLPQQRGLVEVIGLAVDEHDPMVSRELLP